MEFSMDILRISNTKSTPFLCGSKERFAFCDFTPEGDIKLLKDRPLG